MLQQSTEPRAETTQTRRLLGCGIIAGPVFLTASLVQAFTRRGFDLSRHPVSLLSLGDLGWMQIANFVVTGALYLAFAVGMRQRLRFGPIGTWGPRLFGLQGVGMIVAGVFLTDAGAGFPPGAPAGAPELSWHGVLHELGAMLSFLGMLGGFLVCARGFAVRRQRGWAVACVATFAAVIIVVGWPDLETLSVRLVIASAIEFAFVAALAAHLLRVFPTDLRREDLN
jgi:Protein of unknown function (DUF998)